MPIVSQVPTIFSSQRKGWRGSLDEVVNNPLELDLLWDFPWVLGGETWSQKPVSQLQWT